MELAFGNGGIQERGGPRLSRPPLCVSKKMGVSQTGVGQGGKSCTCGHVNLKVPVQEAVRSMKFGIIFILSTISSFQHSAQQRFGAQ